MKQRWEILKRWLGAFALVVLLHTTGLLGGIAGITQTAVLHTGMLNADTKVEDHPEDFDYGFTVKDLEGTRLPFERFKNKVVFLNIWATWCGPCRVEMPTIQRLYDAVGKNENIAFVMLSIDRDEHRQKVIRYITDRGFSFPVFMPSGRLTSQLDVPNIPTTLVISKEGRVILREVGTTNFATRRFQKFLLDEAARP